MDTRKNDLETLRRDHRNTRDPKLRKIMERAGERISKESGVIRDMRKSLIREKRAGRDDNVRDIREDVFKNDKYQNERH